MDHFKNLIRQADLITRHIHQDLTPDEDAELKAWQNERPENGQLFAELTNTETLKSELKILEDLDIDAGWEKVQAAARVSAPRIPISAGRKKWWAAAAGIIVLLSLGGLLRYYFNNRAQPDMNQTARQKVAPILPGGDKAFLTLSDGTVILLDSTGNGSLAREGAVEVIKLDGVISYSGNGKSEGEITFNTISTPKGGQYQIVLSDGSKVWLNAASSLKYPTAFPGKERKVELTGEAFFEVAHNASQPFLVGVPGKMNVVVTGTSFNINAYNDEAITHTTLIEGRVVVSSSKNRLSATTKGAGTSLVLAPGQQASLYEDGKLDINDQADVEEVMAWKNGYFMFDNASVPSIMRQISRWYNVEVVYNGKMNEETFSGMVSRTSSISKVLRIMEEGGVIFKIDGNKIMVK
jgi:transmembrane sensor